MILTQTLWKYVRGREYLWSSVTFSRLGVVTKKCPKMKAESILGQSKTMALTDSGKLLRKVAPASLGARLLRPRADVGHLLVFAHDDVTLEQCGNPVCVSNGYDWCGYYDCAIISFSSFSTSIFYHNMFGKYTGLKSIINIALFESLIVSTGYSSYDLAKVCVLKNESLSLPIENAYVS